MSDKQYEFCLRWCGTKDVPRIRAAVEHTKTVRVFKASEPRIVTHDELNELIKAGEVRPSDSWWGVQPGEVGIVTIANIGNATQWENASNCKNDFITGWDAAVEAAKATKL